MRQIWKRIFEDNLFEGKMPDEKQRKIMYDKCYRRCRRKFRKEHGRYPSKEEMKREIFDCLTDELYRFQLGNEEARKDVGTDFERTGRREQDNREARELAEDIRTLNRFNKNFWEAERQDSEEDREKQNEKLKKWIEKRVRSESGGE